MIEARLLGSTAIAVSKLGLGAGPLGLSQLAESDAERLVAAAVDAGITLFDTARSYGLSEQRLGRHLGARRARVVLSTKLGYGVDGVPDWTGECVSRGIDAALGRLRTDWIDIVHLHSCPLDVLRRDDVTDALAAGVAAGKVRVMAYSGDNAEAAHAVACGRFGALQISLSVVDRAAVPTIARAAASDLGVIAKRPLGNAPWRFATRPDAPDLAEYWRRWTALALEPGVLEWPELALRYAAHHAGVAAAIVGTARIEHLLSAVRAAERGPLSPDLSAALDDRYRERGADWFGVI
jgi:aryl-alcohol dehydrogenase-like predicted oxidoreductase